MNPEAVLDDSIKSQPGAMGNTFVYISGPEGLTSAAEAELGRSENSIGIVLALQSRSGEMLRDSPLF
jgi:hypothetical protein